MASPNSRGRSSGEERPTLKLLEKEWERLDF
jgi:hypothetical protein